MTPGAPFRPLHVSRALCVCACVLLASCVGDATGEPETDAEVSQSLGTNDPGAPPAERRSDSASATATGTAVEMQQAPAPGLDRTDPDPEPWHGGGTGKHD